MIIDPYFDRQYSQFCYTFQYLPGKTTYLDTPVLPVAAFAGLGQFPLDCEYADGTPVIYSAEGTTAAGSSFGGPYVGDQGDTWRWPASTGSASCRPSRWKCPIPPMTAPTPRPSCATTASARRRAPASVTLGGATLPIVSWSDDMIVVRVPGTTANGSAAVAGDARQRQVPASPASP